MTGPPAPPEAPPGAGAEAVLSTGWTAPQAKGPQHWLQDGEAICGARLATREAAHQGAHAWKDVRPRSWCAACVSELVRAGYGVPFRVGDRVVSRAEGMSLYGVVAGIFVNRDDRAMLDLTRYWLTLPADEDDAEERRREAPLWYRYVTECRPAPEPGAKKRKAPPRNYHNHNWY